MTTQINEPVSIADFLSVIRKRWWLLALGMVCFVSLALIYNYKATPIYHASTKVKFENEIVVDQPIKLNEIENRISNLIEVMKTKFFAINVFEALPEHIKASFSSDSSYTENINLAASATKQIKGNLSAEPTKGTEIITISFESKDPEIALIVAQTTTDVLIERNLAHKNKASRHVRRLLEKEIANVDNQLRKAENDLKNFKETNNITVVEDKSQKLLRTMSATEGNLNQVKSNIRETQERLHIIKSKLNSEKKALGTTITNPTDPLVRKLREKLVELETQYTKFLAQGYSPYHPKMQELKNEIERIKQKLRDMVENNFENMDDPLSKISSYLEERSRLETDLQALIAKEKYLTGLQYRYEQLLKQIPTQQKVMGQMIRKRDSLTKRYAMLLEERDKAKFKEAAAIGNIRIIEPAELPTGPVRP
ncbi:MAG: GumC family protein, partial [bacterium]